MSSRNTARSFNTGLPLSGFADGMIISFGLSAALAINNISRSTHLTIVLLASLGGMILLGIATYLSGRDKGYDHSHHHDLFVKLGLDENEIMEASAGLDQEHKEFEGVYSDSQEPCGKTGFLTAVSFFTGYILASLPFLLISDFPVAMAVSFSITPLILFSAGYIRNRVPGKDPLAGGLRYMFLGLFVAAAFCWISWIF